MQQLLHLYGPQQPQFFTNQSWLFSDKSIALPHQSWLLSYLPILCAPWDLGTPSYFPTLLKHLPNHGETAPVLHHWPWLLPHQPQLVTNQA